MSQLPWIASYPSPVRWDAPLALGPAQQILDDAAERFGDRPAVEFMGKRATYAQLNALANRAAKGFQQLGVGPGVHVGLYLPNTPHYLVAFFGVLKAGGTVVNYSPLDAAQVLAHKIEDSETSILVTLDVPALLPQMEALLGTARFTTLVAGGLDDLAGFPDFADLGDHVAAAKDGRIAFRALLANDGAYVQHPIGDPREAIAVLQYTGGTTGLPKGAILTHGNLTAATSQYMETTNVDPPVLVPGEERTLLVLPLFHIYALTAVMLLCVRLGAEMILHPRFDLEAVAKDLAAKKVTIFMGVPTMFAALLAYPGLAELDLTSIKYTGSGGAPLPVEIQERFLAVTGCALNEGWGMTETSPSGTFTPMRGMRKAGSCGLPVPGVRLQFADVNDPAKYVPLGERGEICIKGPNVMKGYWKNPAATAEVMTADGYLRTGDVAYMDDDGFVFIVDRIKDMLLCGGYNVYPRNIEEAIYTHPAVAEVCVIGVPDAYRGQSPKAFVALKRGHDPFHIEELKEFLRDKLGKHEMVSHLEFRESLPKTAVGKIVKTSLYEDEAKKRAAETAEV
ncbi:MAG TPA: long-chain fatty acid--CoA ligase [Candidatus Elarobacter sp.]|nr:long-chain fatty acid--CoA ligase [Candidatus Elarobacter sp.]